MHKRNQATLVKYIIREIMNSLCR